jgi:hypothetical protein
MSWFTFSRSRHSRAFSEYFRATAQMHPYPCIYQHFIPLLRSHIWNKMVLLCTLFSILLTVCYIRTPNSNQLACHRNQVNVPKHTTPHRGRRAASRRANGQIRFFRSHRIRWNRFMAPHGLESSLCSLPSPRNHTLKGPRSPVRFRWELCRERVERTGRGMLSCCTARNTESIKDESRLVLHPAVRKVWLRLGK